MSSTFTSIILYINNALFIILTLLYIYQFVYVFVALFKKPKTHMAERYHKYAFIIAARNEALVIGALIDSINKQDYPSELIKVFVVADNCTDDTAAVAEKAGAEVFVRNNKELVGKGYALDHALKCIGEKYGEDSFDGYFIFDADNLLAKNYVTEMNKVFDSGYKIVTSYRNSKNFDSNWISSGYSLWFMREAKYLNNPRMMLNTSCSVSGTGFLVSSEIMKRNGGWKYNLLTEDIEFTVDSIIHGDVIGYCASAKFYDEQPVTFRQSWHQRLRWAKGFLQVNYKYGLKLFLSIFRKKQFASFDMLMIIAPAIYISIFGLVSNILFIGIGLFGIYTVPGLITETVMSMLKALLSFYLLFFCMGLLTTVTEWNYIYAKPSKKILYTFTFPLFMLTYVPITFAAIFLRVKWKPIQHTINKNIGEVEAAGGTESVSGNTSE